jgi:hypothetical protein
MAKNSAYNTKKYNTSCGDQKYSKNFGVIAGLTPSKTDNLAC